MERANPVTPPSNGLQAAQQENGLQQAEAARRDRPLPFVPDLNGLNQNQHGDRLAPPDLAPFNFQLRHPQVNPLNLWPAMEMAAGNHVIPDNQGIAPRQDRVDMLVNAANLVNRNRPNLISRESTPQRPQNNNPPAEANAEPGPQYQTPPGSPRSPEAARAPAAARAPGDAGTPESARAFAAPEAPNAPKKPPRREF